MPSSLIPGLEQRHERLALHAQPLLERAVGGRERALAAAQRERRPRRMALGPLARVRVRLARRADGVDQTRLQRTIGGHRVAREHHLPRTRETDQTREPLGSTRAGDDAQTYLGQPELRVLRGDPEIAGERHLEAAAEREPSIAAIVTFGIASRSRQACSSAPTSSATSPGP